MPLLIESKGRKPLQWNMNGEDAFPTMDVHDIKLLQADGKELAIILSSYKGIPITGNHTSQVWVGLFAQQIFANLQWVLTTPVNRRRMATGPMED